MVLDHENEIKAAQEVQSYFPTINNISFLEDGILTFDRYFGKAERYDKITVILNQVAKCAMGKFFNFFLQSVAKI